MSRPAPWTLPFVVALALALSVLLGGPAAAAPPVGSITPAAGCHDLTPGWNGVKVGILQQRLGMAASTWETMDATTIAKVRAFQSTRALRRDGVVDRPTWEALGIRESWCIDGFQTGVKIGTGAGSAQRIETFVAEARSYLGEEYVWGGAGPRGYGFDCSGLVLQALYAAGIDPQPITVDKHPQPAYRTSVEMFANPAFSHHPLSQVRRGDLVFYTSDSTGRINHVAISLGGGQLIEARDQDVHTAPLTRSLATQTVVQTVARPFDETRAPTGHYDSLDAVPGGARVVGWARDGDVDGPVDVHVYVDGQGAAAVRADVARGDVGARGFSVTVPLHAGRHSVCVYALNRGPDDANTSLGCRTVTPLPADPVGSLDAVSARPGGFEVRGWTYDPDDRLAPSRAHVYVDGRFAADLAADGHRPDVGRAFAGVGDQHGYLAPLTLPAGSHQVCVYGINTGPGMSNPLLGCSTATRGTAPLGTVDAATGGRGTATVSGWALDPDAGGALDVHVYVDGRGALATRADGPRPDVARHFPGWDAMRGFSATVGGLAPGPHSVCAYAIDVGAGSGNPSLGCRTVTVG